MVNNVAFLIKRSGESGRLPGLGASRASKMKYLRKAERSSPVRNPTVLALAPAVSARRARSSAWT